MKKKGFVLASVVGIMVFVVLLSNIIFLSINFSIRLSTIQTNAFDNNVIYSKIFNEFCQNNGVITNEYDFDIITKQDESNENQKVVAVLNKDEQNKSNVLFYAIYDFDNDELIAKQSKNIALQIKKENNRYYYYLSDIFLADITEYMGV